VAQTLGVPMFHVSSVFAAYDADSIVRERLVPESDHLSKYERSKCRAEWVVEDARRAGLRATVIRIAGVVGDANKPSNATRLRSPLLRILSGQQWPIIPYVPWARIDIVPRDLAAISLADIVRRDEGDSVRHISLGAHAPSVGALASEIMSRLHAEDSKRYRLVTARPALLLALSSMADRFGSGPRATALIGLRYFASSTLYESNVGFAARLTMVDLVRAAGLLPTRFSSNDASSTYYEKWLEAF